MKSTLARSLAARLCALGLLAGATATAAEPPLAGDAAAGAAKAAVCGACHGPTGNSVNPEWPNLAGQGHEYTALQLRLLKAGVRIAPTMAPMALPLGDQDIADLAAHFEKQVPAGLEADAALWQAGERLFRGGDAGRAIPACSGCHGPTGRGNGPAHWPQIHGQHALYTSSQLKNFASRTRYVATAAAPPQAEIMSDIAQRLSDADVKALAAYLQGLR